MSRSAAATSAGRTRTHQRTAAPPAPRRVSGPAPPRGDDGRASRPPRGDDGRASRPPRARIDASALAYADLAYADGALAERYGALPVRRARTYVAPRPRPRRLAYGGVAVASRVAGVALDVSASRFMDRVVRGRVWIAVIAVSLFGLVAMQVSLLKLNSGIGRAVQTVSTLERSNSSLRSDITRMSAGERIQPLAEAQGLVMPAPADVAYLRAGDLDGAAVRAARRMRAPDPATAGPAGSATPAGLDTPVITTTTTAGTTATVPVQPAATAPATSAPVAGAVDPTTGAATAPAAQDVGGTGAAPATTATPPAAATTAPATAAPAAQAQAQAQAQGPAAAVSGGATPQTTTP
jgi:cell division protein FtsL